MVSPDSLSKFIEFGRALRPPRLECSALVTLGRGVIAERMRGYSAFERLVADRPDAYRARWMGETALRRQRLKTVGRAAIDILGRSPDLLGPAGRRFDERLHTNTIAWAMSKPQPFCVEAVRGLVAAIKRGVLRSGAEPFDDNGFDVENVTSIAERSIRSYGRVDVWLETETHVIAIEAKMLAGEGIGQIVRYNQARADYQKKQTWTVVFITVDPEQEPDGPAIQITFKDLLKAWLPIAAAGQSGDHQHLALYLASVARVCGIGRAGTFDDWTFAERREALDLLTLEMQQ